MEKDPDLCYTDQWGRRNYEYVSLGCDTLPVLKGRSPVQCYADFMRAFRDRFADFLGSTIVVCNTTFFKILLFYKYYFYMLLINSVLRVFKNCKYWHLKFDLLFNLYRRSKWAWAPRGN